MSKMEVPLRSESLMNSFKPEISSAISGYSKIMKMVYRVALIM